jgi:hypothetical protein
MRSVRSRLSMPSTASLMCSGRLLRPGPRLPVSRSMFQPNLEVITTLSRNGWMAFAEDAFVLERAVGLGRVEEGDAVVVGGPDDVQHLRPVGHRGLVGAVHVLHAQADTGDLQLAQPRCSARRSRRPTPPLVLVIACRLCRSLSGRPVWARTARAGARPGSGSSASGHLRSPPGPRRQLDIGRAQVLREAMALGGAGDRHDPGLLGQQPGQGDLGRGSLLARGDRLEQIDQRHVGGPGVGGEARRDRAEVGGIQLGGLVDLAGQEARAQRAERHEADAQFLAGGQDAVVLDVARPQRILVLQRGDRLHGVGAAQRVQARLRQAEVPTLPAAIRSFTAPATSSIGTAGSTRCW